MATVTINVMGKIDTFDLTDLDGERIKSLCNRLEELWDYEANAGE